MKTETQSIPLSDSFTLFLYVFRLDRQFNEYNAFHGGNSGLWKRSSVKPDESYLINHVRDFFLINSGDHKPDENQCIIYELKNDHLKEEEKQSLFLFNNLFSKNHSVALSKTADIKTDFTLVKDKSVLSPKIFICPLTSVGILSFSFQLSESCSTLGNLINFNNKLRIFSTGQAAWINTPASHHAQAEIHEKKVTEELNRLVADQKHARHEETGDHLWNLQALVNYFLRDIDKDSRSEISPSRLQALTYVQTAKKISGDALSHALFRLRRLYNYNYVPPAFIEGEDRECLQPFEQVHYGASVEGGVIMLNEDAELLPDFLKNYSSVMKHRNIWTYLLAYHQRIALIAAADEVANLYQEGREPGQNELSATIKKLTIIQLKCMFNEVSHFTQQNDFYYLCCRNLRIPELFGEIKEELSDLNRSLAEQWHKQEEQSKLQQTAMERKRDQKFSILIGLLILPQIWLAFLSTNVDSWLSFINRNVIMFNAVTITLSILILGIGYKIYFTGRKK